MYHLKEANERELWLVVSPVTPDMGGRQADHKSADCLLHLLSKDPVLIGTRASLFYMQCLQMKLCGAILS